MNGLFVLALALIAKHVFGQDAVFSGFTVIGGGLVAVGLYQTFVDGDF